MPVNQPTAQNMEAALNAVMTPLDQPEDPNLIPNAERIRMRQERELARAVERAVIDPAPGTTWNQPPAIPRTEWPDVIGGGTQRPGPPPTAGWGHETIRTYTLQIGVLQRLKDQCDALLHRMMAERQNAQEQVFTNETVRLPYFLVGDFAVVNRREHGEVARYLNALEQTTAPTWPTTPTGGQWTPNPAWINAATTTLADPIITAGLEQANTQAIRAEMARQLERELGLVPEPDPGPTATRPEPGTPF